MKIKILIILTIINFSFISSKTVAAREREGTKVELSAAEVADLKVWIENAKNALRYLKDQIHYLSLDEKRETIKREFEKIISASGKKENELYVRYILNRALDIDERILFNSVVNPNPTNLELEMTVALFMKSIHMALTLYTDDKAYLEAVGQGAVPKQEKHMAVFGYEYAELLINDAKTLLDPSLEYLVTRTALGYLANDLNSPRNMARVLFANDIVRLQRLLTRNVSVSDHDTAPMIKLIRQMKWEYREHIKPNIHSNIKLDLEIRKKKELEIVEAEKRKRDEIIVKEEARLHAELEQKRLEEERRAEAKRFEEEMALQREIKVKNERRNANIKHALNNTKFIPIRSGTFMMGSLEDERGRNGFFETLHKVTLTIDFEMATTAVTQGFWLAVMGNNPSVYKKEKFCKTDYTIMENVEICPLNPVENVSWDDVQVFIQKLNSLTNEYEYRLPTEAEWEFAARAGTQTAYYFGDSEDVINEYAWTITNSQHQTHAVALKKPNRWGLYDMSGNVAQWVADYADYYTKKLVLDPTGPLTGYRRVARGGSRGLHILLLRSAARRFLDPDFRSSYVGFRLVRERK